MKKNSLIISFVSLLLALTLCLSGCGVVPPEQSGTNTPTPDASSTTTDESGFAGGSGTTEDPWQIETAEQLDAVRNALDGNYVLTDDIDLKAFGAWEPLGAFVPESEDESDSADLKLAFTGTFDGDGHKIKNMTISKPDDASIGLFGCVAGESASILDFVMEDISVEGGQLVAGVVGYAAFPGTVENVTLSGRNTITGGAMTGGIAGGGFCNIKDCSVEADVVCTEENVDSGGGAGILAGGMESCVIEGCSAKGTLTASGNGGFFGGLLACAFDCPSITDCTADVTMIVNENAKMVGGLVGHAGSFDPDNITTISNCTVNAIITAPDHAERIGGIIGSGFYVKGAVPAPATFKVMDCQTSGNISGGTIVGTIAGYTHTDSIVENCISDMTINGQPDSPQIGATGNDVTLEELA